MIFKEAPDSTVIYAIRDTLRDFDIPVHSFYHEEALETLESQRAFTLLTLLTNPDDRVALRWWLGSGSPTWRNGQYGFLRIYCEQEFVEGDEQLRVGL